MKGWKREIIEVNEELEGKEIKELDLKVLRIIDGKEIKFPYGNLKLKKGQLIEIFKILLDSLAHEQSKKVKSGRF